uniref:Uncharacterized protein n=1 Tax=mine drainage metagenome TaxID=410659 RepID=E6PF29_9ZZZZ
MQVAHEARLVDRHDRSQAHRYRWILPEIRHQPGVRIGGEPVPVDFLAEIQQLLFADAPFEKCACVEARCGVPLQEEHIAAERFRWRAEKMVEADIVERRRRREARNVAAEFAAVFICANDGRHRVPAHVVAQTRFDIAIARHRGLPLRWNRVDVRALEPERDVRAAGLRFADERFEQRASALGAFGGEHAAKRFTPFQRLLGIGLRGMQSVHTRAVARGRDHLLLVD